MGGVGACLGGVLIRWTDGDGGAGAKEGGVGRTDACHATLCYATLLRYFNDRGDAEGYPAGH